ncbi:MAG: VOC family protein [Planctomycetes bacterium]|nr:VOC family protein [Planctomycetota bacterium]
MYENSRFSNSSLGLLVVYASDMERSATFYRSLGLCFERHTHPPCGDHFASIGDGCVFEICQLRKGQTAIGPMTFGFHVTSVDQAVIEAKENGGTVRREPHLAAWGRSASVIDPDGHHVLLMEKPAELA